MMNQNNNPTYKGLVAIAIISKDKNIVENIIDDFRRFYSDADTEDKFKLEINYHIEQLD